MAEQQEVFTPLNELDTTHSGRSVICVKVFVKWTQSYFNNPKEIASHDMILIDHEGNKIVGTVKKHMYENTFSQTVLEGKYLRIDNFGVQPYKGPYKLVNHGFKVVFGRLTRATITEEFTPVTFGFNPVSYDDLLKGIFPQTKPIDVVGQINSVQNKKVKVEEDVEQKSTDFIMRDKSSKQVKCTVWGEHADQLAEYVRAHLNDETPRVIMIHNGKLGKFVAGAPQVSNQLFGCCIFTDESIGPIKDFISSLNQNDEYSGNVPKFADKDFGTDRKTAVEEYKVKGVPIVHVEGIRFLSEDGYCVTKAEVKKIFSEMGWFTYACKNCHEKVGNKIMGPGGEWVHYCSTYNGNTTDVFHKLRMTIQVADKSGSATFVVFASQLSKMLKKSIVWLSTKMQSVANPTVVPDDIGILLLKEYVFKVRVSNFNHENDYDAYTIDKVTEDPTVISAIGSELEANMDQNNDLNDTPNAKVPTNNTDGTDVTPSSASLKRKTESNDAGSSGSYKAAKNLETLNIAKMDDICDAEDSEAVD
ncbi:uncharacterized protein [Rutidosis leptorrhynchoides]|uniref:uncharacterized protein n=1 Tax=Rutidosis leptorrhynchoides TaxID=125765 RepID=UPI003A99BCBC